MASAVVIPLSALPRPASEYRVHCLVENFQGFVFTTYGSSSQHNMSSVLFGQPNRSFNPLNHESHHEDNTAALAGPWLMFSSSLSVSTVCGLLLVVFLAFNIKNLPGMWHVGQPP